MTGEAWIVTAAVILILIGLARGLATPAVLTFSGVVLLLIVGVIGPSEAFSGFANPAPFTVGGLFVIARAVSKSGAIRPATQRVMGKSGFVRRPLLRMLGPVAGASAFMNNIPLVAMMIPEISAWARRRQSDPSKFLLPLSYGAILGGLLTVIGTSTNLVVVGHMESVGLEPLGFFEIAKVGLPVAVVGLAVIVGVGPRLLGSTQSPRIADPEISSDYLIEMVVIPGGPLDGITVDEAGLRHLKGVFLAAVQHHDGLIDTVDPKTVLAGGDRLRFVGRVDLVLDLQEMRGLEHVDHANISELSQGTANYFIVALGQGSPLIGKNLRQANFRSKYQAAVMAIHRSGVRVDSKLGDVVLRPGDALILLSDTDFLQRWQHQSDFAVASRLGDEIEPASPGRVRTLAILGVVIASAASGLVPILHASLAGALMTIASGVLTPTEARRAVDVEVVGTIASAFGLAAAVDTSGLATALTQALERAVGGLGQFGILACVVVATIALTEFVTNNAAALLMLPIALTAAGPAGVDPRGMAIAVAISASASFLTPLGYQTNTMVYGPGGYRLKDYMVFGAPLTLLCVIAVILLVPVFY